MEKMNKLVCRAYNRFEQDSIKNTITKFSKETRLKNESNYYSLLPGDLKIFFPRLLKHGYHELTQEYFMEIEYYPYYNLSDILFFERSSGIFYINSIAKKIGNILSQFNKYKPPQTSISDVEKIYIEKTEIEQRKLVEGFQFFNELSKHDIIKINGKEYENFHVIWPKIKKDCIWILLHNVNYSVIHGDMCFSNILCGQRDDDLGFEQIIKFIDPRGEFGQHKIYGDIYYDLAKLHHSTNTGYELIINDKFSVNTDSFNEVNFVFDKSIEERKNKIHEAFTKYVYSNYMLHKIKLVEATIYIGMCARHYDSLERQKIMYSSGLKLLNEAYNEIINLPNDDYH